MATAFRRNGRKSMKRTKTTAKNLSKLRPVISTRNSIAERKNGEATITGRSVLPCITDEELRRALKSLLDLPQTRVAIAGGIVRHDIR